MKYKYNPAKYNEKCKDTLCCNSQQVKVEQSFLMSSSQKLLKLMMLLKYCRKEDMNCQERIYWTNILLNLSHSPQLCVNSIMICISM